MEPRSLRQIVKTEITTYEMADLVFELLNGSTKVHLNHLLVNGQGSYAAHKAMNEFYDALPDIADSLAEGYQGITETLLTYPTIASLPTMTNAEDCVDYLRELYSKVNRVQEACRYSELKNELDELKSLINSTKYKLIFLK